MPLGAAVMLLSKEDNAFPGLASVGRMDAGYMQSVSTRHALLHPAPAHPALVDAAGGFPSLVPPAPAAPPPLPARGSSGLSLKKGLQALPHFNIGLGSACNRQACLAAQAKGTKGFVRGAVTYNVMDDLTVTPVSNISSVALLHKLGVEDLGALEERTVKIGYQEASLQSSTVLTDVFLAKKDEGAHIQRQERRLPANNIRRRERASMRRRQGKS